MVIKNGKSAATKRQPKPAPNSAKSNRSPNVPKSDFDNSDQSAAAELDGIVNDVKATTLEGEKGDRILEETGADDGASGDAVSAESVELNAITLHQPWASLVAAGKKHYETRSWATDYRGPIAIHAGKKFHEDKNLTSLLEIELNLFESTIPLGAVVAIAQLTDCILMSQEFINEQSSFEQYLGLWEPGNYAWKLENVRAIAPIPATGKQGLWKWNPDDFGELHHVAEADGQLNLLDWTDKKPPEPDDYASIEQFDAAYKQWCDAQTDEAEEELANFGEQELCNQLIDGSTFAQESVPVSPMPESNCGEGNPINSVKEMATVATFLSSDIPLQMESLPMLTTLAMTMTKKQTSLLPAPHANPSQLMEKDSQQLTIEIASQQSSQQSEITNPNLQSSKMSLDSSTAPTPPATNQEATSTTSSTPYRQTGTMRNGSVSGATNLPLRGVGKDYLLLRSPGALSATGKTSPPGKTRLENQLQELNLISPQEVAAPEFLEAGYQLPIGFSNPAEERTALELANLRSELPAATASTEIAVQPSETLSTGELEPLPSNELLISLNLPPNIGALTKTELISAAQEQHQLINSIEKKEFELALEKLHRVRLTGVYLQEFKKRCKYGEFENQLEQAGISIRSAQNYMAIAKNWEIIESKAKLVSLLSEESQPAIGLKWALEAVRDEKKGLKSAAAPFDPDCWQTPNTKDQPIVDLVVKALGGSIWLDPCSHPKSRIPVSVRYYKDGFDGDGLAENQIWNKTVFVNPPFSDPYPWVEKCCLSIALGTCSAAIMLLKSGTLSNVGTGELINKYASAVCHWRGRIAFLNDEGNPVKGSDFDCVFVYFGSRLDLFRQAFQQRGTIATIDNHYSSVNKKFLEAAPLPEPQTLKSEQKQLAAAMGLGNGRSVLPDRRDFDRELAERYDPHTVVDVLTVPTMPPTVPTPASENLAQPLAEPEIFDETPLATRQFETAKQNCLNDYVIAISGNITEFSDEQLKFLVRIAKKELNNRNHPEYFRQRPRKRQN